MRRLLIALALLAVVACQQKDGGQDLADTNAVYYWRTDLRLDSTERAFLKHHHINKVYCRYFDVVMTPDGPMPNATITFSDTLPAGIELVPTVFITEDCMHQHHDSLARRLAERIRQMNETNGLAPASEVQIDCDYTARSRQPFYHFLSELRGLLSAAGSQLSATIRLHQLAMPAPPVDYGVLMLYNTGDPRRFADRHAADGRLLEEGRNPVLDRRDVAPYLRYLDGYSLPLGAAYPVYQWVRRIHGVRVEHTVDADEILSVKRAVEHERQQLRQLVVTYHLDKENINRYETQTYEAIYRH